MPRKIEAHSKIDAMIGRKIEELRIAKGLSQQELGKRIGVTFQQISKYTKGMNRISAGRLQAIAKVFDKPIGYFFEEKEMRPHLTKREKLALELSNEFLNIKNTSLQDSIVMMVRNIARTTH